MEQIKTKNIHQKIQACMAGSGWLEKTGRNDMQRYDYATAADAIAMIRHELIAQGVTLAVNYENEKFEQITYGQGKTGNLFSCAGVFTLTNTDAPSEQVIFRVPGHALDSGDKAPWKCLTGILKYFLFQAFMIPTGDDPEADQEVDRQPKAAPKAPTATANRWFNYVVPRENAEAIKWCQANIKAGAFEFVDSQPEGEVYRAFMSSPLLKLKNFLVG